MSDLLKVMLADVPDVDKEAIAKRLFEFAKKLETETRKKSDNIEDILAASNGEDVNLGFNVFANCRRRADRLVDARIKSSQFSHLKKPEIDRLMAVNEGVILSGVITESQADEIASNIHKEFSWLPAATNEIWNNMRTSVRLGRAVKIGAVLMNGPPGIGKTAFSSFVAKSLKLHFTDIETTYGRRYCTRK